METEESMKNSVYNWESFINEQTKHDRKEKELNLVFVPFVNDSFMKVTIEQEKLQVEWKVGKKNKNVVGAFSELSDRKKIIKQRERINN